MCRVQFTILARDKEKDLPMFLQCLENSEFDKKRIDIYAHTNNNNDNTGEMLREWCEKNKNKYASVKFIEEDILELRDKPGRKSEADWYEDNGIRLQKLGEIRQKSLEYAYAQKSKYYFVCDIDNFFPPETIAYCVNQNRPIIAPLMVHNTGAFPRGFYLKCAENGYWKDTDLSRPIWNKDLCGVFQVDLVHMCYMIHTDNIMRGLSYHTDGTQMEYVTFSRSARENGIQQYVSNEIQTLIDPTDNYDLNVDICRNLKYNIPYEIKS